MIMKKVFVMVIVVVLCLTSVAAVAEKSASDYLQEGLATYAFREEINGRIIELRDKYEKEGTLTKLEGELLLCYLRTSYYLGDTGMIEADRAMNKTDCEDNTALMMQATDVLIETLDDIELRYDKGEMTFDEMITWVMAMAVGGISIE